MTETLMLEAYDYLMRERKAEKARFEKQRKGTNADKIRAMTDEELAIWTAHIAQCIWCPAKNITTDSPCKGFYSACKGNWLDWLKQEVKE